MLWGRLLFNNDRTAVPMAGGRQRFLCTYMHVHAYAYINRERERDGL